MRARSRTVIAGGIALVGSVAGCRDGAGASAGGNVLSQPVAPVELTTSPLASAGFRVARGGVGARVVLRGARDVREIERGGALVFPRALDGAARVVVRRTEDALEDTTRFDRPPPVARLVYDVELEDVAGLRLVERTLELLDASGAPRVRVAPPFTIDARGVVRPATLDVLDCAVDRDLAPPFDRAPTAPGRARCAIEVTWSVPPDAYPIDVDPAWGTAASLEPTREQHTATVLDDGRVLVTGGSGATGGEPPTDLASCAIYDVAKDAWAMVGSLTYARRGHFALKTSGGVLVFSGILGKSDDVPQAELFDPKSGKWGVAMHGPARAHLLGAVASLGKGAWIVMGGKDLASGLPYLEPEIYTEIDNAWSAAPVPSDATAVYSLSATSLGDQDTRVLFAGGTSSLETGALTDKTFVYDGKSAMWTRGPSLLTGRYDHRTVLLADGTLLVVGGVTGAVDASPLDSIELLPAGQVGQAATFSNGPSTMIKRWRAEVVPFANAHALVLGGTAADATSVEKQPEIYVGPTKISADPALAWKPPRQYFSATRLLDGRVLVAGGATLDLNGATPTSHVDLFGAKFGTPYDEASCINGDENQGKCCATPTGDCLTGVVGTSASASSGGGGASSSSVATSSGAVSSGAGGAGGSSSSSFRSCGLARGPIDPRVALGLALAWLAARRRRGAR